MSKALTPQQNELIFYTTPDGAVHVEVFFQDETFWLSQKRMAELFTVDVRTVNEHLQNIFTSGELQVATNYPEFPDSSKRGSNEAF